MAKTREQVPVHPGSKFCWNAQEKIGFIDVSDFEPDVKWYDLLYHDVWDIGFYVVSHKTGVKKLFAYAGERRQEPCDPDATIWQSDDGIKIFVVYD